MQTKAYALCLLLLLYVSWRFISFETDALGLPRFSHCDEEPVSMGWMPFSVDASTGKYLGEGGWATGTDAMVSVMLSPGVTLKEGECVSTHFSEAIPGLVELRKGKRDVN